MELSTVSCARCGKLDPTVRLAKVTFVVSVLVMSFRRGGKQVLCAGCRIRRATEYSIVTLFAGWWGIAWGLIWTPISLVENVRTAVGAGRDRKANAAVLALASTELLALGRSLESGDARNEALALDRDIANATIEAPQSVAAALAPQPSIPLRQRLRRPRTVREWLAVGVVAVFAGGIAFYGGGMYYRRAFPHAVPLPTTPVGGTVLHTADFAIALPNGWESIAMDAARIDASLDALRSKQPSLTIEPWARAQLNNHMLLAAVYVGPEATQFRFVPAVTLLLDDTSWSSSLRGYADGVASALSRDSVVKKPIERRQSQLPGGAAEVFHYTVVDGDRSLDVTRVVMYDTERWFGYQLRFDSLPSQAAAMQTYVAAIASSLRTPQSGR